MRPAVRFRSMQYLALGIATALVCSAQGWDGATLAKGWARQDVTGAFTFRDANTLRTWTKDGSLSGQVDISKVESTPDAWVMDPWDNAWVAAGTSLYLVDKSGKITRKEALPAAVADLAWDGTGFYLSYRTEAYYLEKRDFKKGEVVWSAGTKPKKGDSAIPRFYRIAISPTGQVVMSLGAELNLQIFNTSNGKPLGQTSLALGNRPAPPLQSIAADRGGMVWSDAKSQLLITLPASQLPPWAKGSFTGLLLGSVDFSKGTLELMATGLPEDASLVGAQESEVTLAKPEGGLVSLSLK